MRLEEKTSNWESRAGIDQGLSHSLDLLSDTYNYNHWIYSLCRSWLGQQILEVGAGIGNLTQFMLGAERLVCIEPETEYQAHLTKLSSTHTNVKYYQVPVDVIPRDEINFDSAVCVNVLEHIEDDRRALIAMASHIRVNGYIVLYVPAVEWAYGNLDKGLGHYRRYTKARIRALVSGLSLSVEKVQYVNLIGLFGWWWSGRVKGEQLIDPAKARLMDRLVPWVAAVERILPIPLGQSLLAVLKKTNVWVTDA